MDAADAELIAEFAIESQEGLANIEQQMLTIETAGADIDVDVVNSVFRTMHSIKGAAGFLGLDRIGTLAHSLEEVLNRMRNRDIVPSSELVTTILHAADTMKGLIDAVETSNEADVSHHVSALQRFREGEAPGTAVAHESTPAPVAPTPEPVATPPASTAAATHAPTPIVINETVREFLIECYENLTQMEQDLLALEHQPDAVALIRGIFRTTHTIKGGAGFLGLGRLERLAHAAENLLGRLRDGALTLTGDIVNALLASVTACREGLRMLENQGHDEGLDPEPVIQQLLAAEGSNKRIEKNVPARVHPPTATATPTTAVVNSESTAPATTLPAATPNASTAPASPVTKAAEPATEPGSAEKQAASVSDSTIRVDVALLDKLMTRVGELVLARNQILQFTSSLEDAGFIRTVQRLNLITAELQESVMKTRMQPIGNVWAKFPRVVRDLASQLGKQVRIDMEGKDTELDKTIIEAIKDPLTHLIRNSVDHGVETPEVRRAAGKPVEGRLLLRAYHEGGQVNIEITDDGAGLNLDRIRKKAIERGLLTAEQAARMSDRETSQLIFAPGFSTAETVTSVSGRGVGMDVVRTNIERISGTIDLHGQQGIGTTIKIKIPLTLAIIPALTVTNSGERYAIPQVSLLELVRLEGTEAQRCIESVHGAPVYRLRGKLLPLVYLSERLGVSRSPSQGDSATATTDSAVNIVVLRADDRPFGLVVDKINDTEEIVVKPLGKQLKGIAEYAGATIMGDGAVALILDVKGLAMAAGVGAESRINALNQDESASDTRRRVQTMIVVDGGPARRYAMPTSMVARLEKIAAETIEYAEGREVVQYRGAILPLVRLSQLHGASTEPLTGELPVVVYDEAGVSVGLVVDRIVDIADVECDVQEADTHATDEFILGTVVIQGRVTDVLHFGNLVRGQGQLRSMQRMHKGVTV